MKKLAVFIVIMLCLLIAGCNIPKQQSVLSTTASAKIISVGITQEETIEETQEPTQTPTVVEPTPVSTATPIPVDKVYFKGSSWYNVGFVSRNGLKYNENAINSGGTPACIQMILDFWHLYNRDYPTMDAQEIIDKNILQGQFNERTGLNILNAQDELEEMNYHFGVKENSSKKELLAALEKYGPLLVLVKEKYVPAGADYIAVVAGYDQSKDIIRLMDPMQTGGIMEFYFDNFDSIWAQDYSNDPFTPQRRTFYYIIPKDELRPGEE